MTSFKTYQVPTDVALVHYHRPVGPGPVDDRRARKTKECGDLPKTFSPGFIDVMVKLRTWSTPDAKCSANERTEATTVNSTLSDIQCQNHADC